MTTSTIEQPSSPGAGAGGAGAGTATGHHPQSVQLSSGQILKRGEGLEEYCQDNGICPKCCVTKTHRRVFKLFGGGGGRRSGSNNNNSNKFEPITSHDPTTGEYLVYQGYCLRPSCFTQDQARTMLADIRKKEKKAAAKRSGSGRGSGRKSSSTSSGGGRRKSRNSSSSNNNTNNNRRSTLSASNRSLMSSFRRPGSRRTTKTNPDTGSVVGRPPRGNDGNDGDDDDISIDSQMSGLSTMSGVSILSGISGISGFGGFGGFGGKSGRRSKSSGTARGGGRRSGRRSNKRSSSSGSSLGDDSSVMSGVSEMSGMSGDSFDSSDDDDDNASVMSGMSDVSGMSTNSMFSVGMNQALKQPTIQGEISPVVQHRITQLLTHEYFVLLDLTSVDLSPAVDLDALGNALRQTKTLETIILDQCCLDDNSVEPLAGAIEESSAGLTHQLKKLSLSQNKIGNRGVQALEFLFRTSTTLEELNLSGNAIGSKGVSSILSSFKENRSPGGGKLTVLNMSQNEIWDLEEARHGFLKTNTTLKELNLDGNFLHDEGVEQIGRAISMNKKTALQKLFVGWNGVGDDGALALAKMIEKNLTIQVLGLSENDITNTGARSLLSSLSINTSVTEISGLYHNQIDRKFIIVAIKRLLARPSDRGSAVQEDGNYQVADSSTAVNKDRIDETKTPEDVDTASQGSFNWADQKSSDPNLAVQDSPPPMRSSAVALEFIDSWDWGHFGLEEIEEASKDQDDGLQMADFDDTEAEDDDEFLPTSSELRKDRLVVFNSAPLASFSRLTQEHESIPLLDFKYDTSCISDALADKEGVGADLELHVEIATAERFRSFFTEKPCGPILQLTSYGSQNDDGISLENGLGYTQTLSKDELKKLVSSSKLQVAVLVSCYPAKMARTFVDAGVPHVVSIQREKQFRDETSTLFVTTLYQQLAKNRSLRDAFFSSMNVVKDSSLDSTSVEDRYRLLPTSSTNHDVHVLFKTGPSRLYIPDKPDPNHLPPLPENFVGRSLDIYETLELLRSEDVIRVEGPAGVGKVTMLSALSHYITDRQSTFKSSVFWLPSPADVVPQQDSLYGDLGHVAAAMIETEDDIWDEEDFIDARERIMLELEDQRAILIIDSRKFVNEASSEMLERFITLLLNEASVKIILIAATSRSRRKSRSDETTIELKDLDFRSSALLFGKTCPLVMNDHPMVRSGEEFCGYLFPPSLTKKGQEQASSRREELLHERLGKGRPRGIIDFASSCTESELYDLLQLAKRPEIFVTSSAQLAEEESKLKALRQKAVEGQNFLFATDLDIGIQELEALREKYPTIEQLMEKETSYKKKFVALLKAKRYDDANLIKRKILVIKRSIMKERESQNSTASSNINKKNVGATTTTAEQSPLEKLRARMKEMQAGTDSTSTATETSSSSDEASFVIASSESTTRCVLKICRGSVTYDFEYTNNENGTNAVAGLVCWTPESCDLNSFATGKSFLSMGGTTLQNDISSIEVITETPDGMARITRGDSICVGPDDYGTANYILLAGAVPTDGVDLGNGGVNEEKDGGIDIDVLHYHYADLRSAVRGCFHQIQTNGIEAVGIPTPPYSTNANDDTNISNKKMSSIHRWSLDVVLDTIQQELRTSDSIDGSSSLKMVHVLASTFDEAKYLIDRCVRLGLKSCK